MNLSQMRQMSRDLLNEATAGFWTDPQLNRYLNTAHQRLNSIISTLREDYFTVSATFTTVVGTKSYAWPTDCVYIRRIEIIDPADPSSIIKVDELKFPRTEAGGDWLFTAPGQPLRYIIRGRQFDLWPIPDAIYTMRIYYAQLPPDIVNDIDVPTSPLDFHDMIVFYACALAMKQNEVEDGGFMGLFKERRAELIQEMAKRGGEEGRFPEAYLEGII